MLDTGTTTDLNQRIIDKGVTKAHVAKMVGITSSTLSCILKGKKDYGKTATISKIDTYLNRINTDDPTILND